MTKAAIIKAIHTSTNLSKQDLLEINDTLVKKLKADRKAEIKAAKAKFKVGDTVTFGSPRTRTGTIIKVNRTRCIVDCGGLRGQWKVPMTMLETRVVV